MTASALTQRSIIGLASTLRATGREGVGGWVQQVGLADDRVGRTLLVGRACGGGSASASASLPAMVALGMRFGRDAGSGHDAEGRERRVQRNSPQNGPSNSCGGSMACCPLGGGGGGLFVAAPGCVLFPSKIDLVFTLFFQNWRENTCMHTTYGVCILLREGFSDGPNRWFPQAGGRRAS